MFTKLTMIFTMLLYGEHQHVFDSLIPNNQNDGNIYFYEISAAEINGDSETTLTVVSNPIQVQKKSVSTSLF